MSLPYPRRPADRPKPRRHRAKGPAAMPPMTYLTRAERKRMLTGSVGEMKRLTRLAFSQLWGAADAELMAWAEAIPAGDGRRGRARRAAMKVIRLREPRAAA